MVVAVLDEMRAGRGLRTVTELAGAGFGSTVLDPYSTILSQRVEVGDSNVFYPNVVILCDGDSACTIGSGNTFHPGTLIVAEAGGTVVIGDGCTIGEGGTRVKATRSGAVIDIGDQVRLLGGAEAIAPSVLGPGSQIIGPVRAQSVRLAGGGDYRCADPDERGAVLKGSGVARHLTLGVGEVVNGLGDFTDAPVERQRAHHPKRAGG